MFASIALIFSANASSTAFLAAGFASGCGSTFVTSVVPFVLAVSTSAFVLAASMLFLASVAFAFASAFAAAFSSAVKSLFASIASFLAFKATSIAFLAAGLACAVGFTESTDVAPSVLACSTAAFVIALSIACFAAVALSCASCFAVAFSSSVRSLFTSIALIFSANASSTAFFAAVFDSGCGFTLFTSVVPSVLA